MTVLGPGALESLDRKFAAEWELSVCSICGQPAEVFGIGPGTSAEPAYYCRPCWRF